IPIPRASAAAGVGNVTGSPRTRTVPASGCTSPNATRMSVVLPAPFSPSSAWTAPARGAIEASASASTRPKRFATCSSESAAGSVNGSQAGGDVDERPGNVERARDVVGQRANAERLGGVVPGVDDRYPVLVGLDRRPVWPLADDECINRPLRRLAQRVRVRAGAGADRPAARHPPRLGAG